MKELFHTGGALQSDVSYVSRVADWQALQRLEEDHAIYVRGHRQCGKTSFLNRLARRLKERDPRWTCCYINLGILDGLDRPRWIGSLCDEIARSRELTTPGQLEDQHDFKRFLEDSIGLRTDATFRFALFFDGADVLKRQEFADPFLMTLRYVFEQRTNYAGNIRMGFAGACDPSTLVSDPYTSPFNIVKTIVLEDFNLKESLELSSRLSALGITASEEAHGQIYSWASGHPHLTQRICEVIEEGKISKITGEVIDDIVRNDLLAHSSRDVNVAHVLKRTWDLGERASELWGRMLAGEVVSSSEPGYGQLELTGAVRSDDSSVAIRNKIYAEAVRQHKVNDATAPAPPATRNDSDSREAALIRDRVFVSYSHHDRKWWKRLEKMLAPLVRGGVISLWADTAISAGADWRQEIENALASARVAVLLVSANFLASDFIAREELPPLLLAAEEEGVRILWVYLKPCLYQQTPIGKYQAAHDVTESLSELKRPKQARVLLEISEQIQEAVAESRPAPVADGRLR